MRNLVLVLAVVLMVGAASAAVQQGMSELTLQGSYRNTDSAVPGEGRDETVEFQVGYGVFMTNEVQVGVRGGFASEASAFRSYSLGVFGNYHFQTDGMWVPYVGGQIALSHYDVDGGPRTTGYYWGPQGGVKMFLNADAALFLEYQWREYQGGVDSLVDDEQVVLAGLAVYF